MSLLFQSTTAIAGSADRDEKTFIWKARPTRPWPADAKTMAVRPPVFDASGMVGGIVRSTPEAWYMDFMGELKILFTRGLPGVKIVERIDTAIVTDEQLRNQSGLSDGPAEPPKLRAAGVTLVPRFTYEYDDRPVTIKGNPFKKGAGRVFRSIIPGGEFLPSSEENEVINVRRVIVACDLKLLSNTGVTLFTYSRSLAWRGQTREGWFGVDERNTLDLPDTHTIIKRLMKEHAQEFCSEFMPIRKEIKVNLSHLSSKLEQAVAEFNAGRIDAAGRIARARYTQDHSSHHALFILGICAEARGDWDAAAECYRRAVSLKNQQLEYQNALERVQGRDVVGVAASAERTDSVPEGDVQQDHEGVGAVKVRSGKH